MSASKEKRRRQEDKSSGVVVKNAREEKNKQENKKIRNLAIAIAAVVVVLLAAALFINSKYVRRNLTALRINDVNYTVTDCNYYYYSTYFDYLSTVYTNFGDSASALLPDSSKPFGSQIHDEETGETWADFFEEMALSAMQDDAVVLSEARSVGYQLSAEKTAEMDQQIEDMKQSVAEAGSFKTYDAYLEAYYGNGMNEASFRRVAEMKYIVDEYSEYVRNSFTYTQDDLENNYQEHRNTLDVFNYRYFLVYSEEVDETLYEGDEAGLEAAEQEAMDAAMEKAVAYMEGIHSEEDMIAAARDYDAETYKEDDSTFRAYKGELLGSIYGDWLREDERKEGDVTTAETTTGFYVVYFISRSDNHYDTVNARVLTVVPETVDSSQYADDEDTSAYNTAVKEANAEAASQAKTLYENWTADGATEEAFITMFNENSEDDTYEEGYAENIPLDQFPDAVDEWLYDPARQPGDHALVAGGTTQYILYYKGVGRQYSDVISEDKLRTNDYNDWKDSISETTVKKTWVYALAE